MTDVLITQPKLAVDVAFPLFGIGVIGEENISTPLVRSETAPVVVRAERMHDAVASELDKTTVIGEAPFDGLIKGVLYTPKASITGADGDTRSLLVRNKGQDGSATVTVAQITFSAGTDATGFAELAIPLSDVLGDTYIVAGDIIVLESVHSGDGLADPGGLIKIEFTRR